MSDVQQTNTVPAPQRKAAFILKPLHKTLLIGLGGMILGAIVSVGVEQGIESTGLLGPGMESLIAEQQANFDAVTQQLAALEAMSSDPQVKSNLQELTALLERQGELSNKANAELAYLGDQVSVIREQQLKESGFSTGADFWLKSGESVTVGDTSQVFALIGSRANIADVNVNGARRRITVGDNIAFDGEQICTVFYKLATPRADGRVGFDISCG